MKMHPHLYDYADSAEKILKLLRNIRESWNFISFDGKNKHLDLNHYHHDDALSEVCTTFVTNSPGAHVYCCIKSNAYEH